MAKKSKSGKEQESQAQKIRDFIDKVNQNIKEDLEFDDHNRIAAIDDLEFSNPGDPQQWSADNVRNRQTDGRPCLTINLFPQYINQVVGDIRHNRPRAKIVPADLEADPSIAKIREGIISDSEYQSNSDYIFVEAGATMTTCGYGAWQVKTRYCEDNPFLQEMYDELIEDPFTVIMDCHAKDPIFADANRGAIITVIPNSKFEADYPDAELPSSSLNFTEGMPISFWLQKDHVTVVQYFERIKEKRTLCQMVDGSVMEEENANQLIADWEENSRKMLDAAAKAVQAASMGPGAAPGADALPSQPGAALPPMPPIPPKPAIARTRKVDKTVVKKWVLTASDILSKNGLEGEKVPGEYIPIVFVTGNRTVIKGKRYISGLVRNAKDPARNVNYWYSSAAERIALEPKAPWIGTAKQFEGYEKDYAAANLKNFPFLKYNPDVDENGNPIPMPQRMGPGQIPSSLLTQLQTSLSLFESAIGMHKSDVGADEGQGRTGAAVIQRQVPGDIGTFTYIDNLARGISHGARIKNSMIPELYDTERDVRLMDAEQGSETYVPINTTAGEAYQMIMNNPEKYRGLNTVKLTAALQKYGPDAKYNDISAGKYAVKVVVGPSYATQRAESASAMMSIVQAYPMLMEKVGDLIFQNLNIKDGDDVASRLRKMMPPGIVKLRPGEQPYVPPTPPQVQLTIEKEKTEQIRQQKEVVRLRCEMVKLLKQTKESETEVRKQILDVLEALHSPLGSMPEDQIVMQGMED